MMIHFFAYDLRVASWRRQRRSAVQMGEMEIKGRRKEGRKEEDERRPKRDKEEEEEKEEEEREERW